MKASIAVIGSGPAGTAAALTLRRYVPDVTVALISPEARSHSIGEALSPGALPLLRYLGLDAEFRTAGHRSAHGIASAWGAAVVQVRSNLFSGLGHGWHLDRARFDAWLMDQAIAAGSVRVLKLVRRQDLDYFGDKWRIKLDDGLLEADVVIDASGRVSRISRDFVGPVVHDDALVAEIKWFDTPTGDPTPVEALVEAAPGGWWYTARLSETRGVAMYMTDGDLLRQEDWGAHLADAPATAQRLEHWSCSEETAVRPANSQTSTQVTGPGWVAAGDAAAGFDPLSSLGIGFALSSGIEAARVATGLLEGSNEPAAEYSDSLRRIYADYRQRLSAFYHAERRWPNSPFWYRRHSPADTRRDIGAV